LRSDESRVPKPRDPSQGPNRFSNIEDLTDLANENFDDSDEDVSESVPN